MKILRTERLLGSIFTSSYKKREVSYKRFGILMYKKVYTESN